MRRELFKLPEADDAELFCKEVSEFALSAVQEDRNTAVINAVAAVSYTHLTLPTIRLV